MLCPACGDDKHPSVELGGGTSNIPGFGSATVGGKMIAYNMCGGCHHNLGPVKPIEVVSAPAIQTVAPSPARAPLRMPPMGVSSGPVDYVAMLRARLIEVEAQIIDQAALRAEKKRLLKMLKVADGDRPDMADLPAVLFANTKIGSN